MEKRRGNIPGRRRRRRCVIIKSRAGEGEEGSQRTWWSAKDKWAKRGGVGTNLRDRVCVPMGRGLRKKNQTAEGGEWKKKYSTSYSIWSCEKRNLRPIADKISL